MHVVSVVAGAEWDGVSWSGVTLAIVVRSVPVFD